MLVDPEADLPYSVMLQVDTDHQVEPVDVTKPAPPYVPYYDVSIDKMAPYRYRNNEGTMSKDIYDSPPSVQVAHSQKLI